MELAEVDGFWCDRDLPPERIGTLDPADRPTWSDYFAMDGDSGGPRLPGNLTHLPVFFDYQPDPDSVPRTPHKRAPRQVRDSYTPVYVERSWRLRALANLENLTLLAMDPVVPLERLYLAIRDGTLHAAKKVNPATPHASTATYRLFHNTAMPTAAAFVDDPQEARRLGSWGRRLRQRARLSKTLSSEKCATLEVKGKRLLERPQLICTKSKYSSGWPRQTMGA